MYSFHHTNSTPKQIRVAVADDHAIFLDGLKTLLKKEKEIKIVAQASNGIELLKAVDKEQPDVVLTDIQMPIMDGIEATMNIRKKYPSIEIIGLSSFDNESMLLDMLSVGAKGYLLKNTTKVELKLAIKTVYNRGTYYCPTTANKIVRLMARSNLHPYKQDKRVSLTEREIEIIRLMCQENSSKEIATQLGISSRSIESARERLQEKIGAKNMIGIAIYAIRNAIFSVD